MKKSKLTQLLSRHTEERDFFISPIMGKHQAIKVVEFFQGAYSPAKTLTLKGRIEWFGDRKAVLECIAKARGIIHVCFWDFTFEITWLLENTDACEGVLDHREDAIAFISEFIMLLRQKDDLHVFIQSLKPIDQYDGERNGLWAQRVAPPKVPNKTSAIA